MYIKLIFILLISYCEKADFSENNSTYVEIFNRNSQGRQLSQYQLKNSYDQFIDDIITKGVTDLAFSLHRSAKKYENNDYLVYSPISIATALYMLLLGSNGQTFAELSEILGVSHGVNIINNSIKIHEEFGEILRNLESSTNDGTLVKFANGLFVQNDFPLRQQYIDVSSLIYQSETMNLDFRGNSIYAKDFINNWTNTKTYGKIQTILNDSPSPDTKLIIASTVYFKADWNTIFDNSLTSIQTFYPNGKTSSSNVKYNQMAIKAKFPYYNDSTLNCEIVGLPYKGNEYTFYILLPYNSNRETLKQFENRLTYNDIKRLTANTTPKELIVAIPKMKLSSNLQLNDVLEDNGLHSIFNPHESNLELLLSSNDDIIPSYSSIPNQFEEAQFIFSRMKDPSESGNSTTRKKRGISKKTRRQIGQIKKVLSTNKDNFDSLRHNLSKKLFHGNDPKLHVNKILHKVVIDVNEKGTEAAATTAAFLEKRSVPVFKVNVPFVFFIQHEESKMILFWGSVTKPSPNFVL